MPVPVIDLFAGPGGLGEGLSRAITADFRTVISIEKDGMAARTLTLRAAHRTLKRTLEGASTVDPVRVWALWDAILAEAPWKEAIDRLEKCGIESIVRACKEARHEAQQFELGPYHRTAASDLILDRLKPYMTEGNLPKNIVLIGGPPCQAYSVVGRARNRGKEDYRPEQDHRHFLYKEYLQVIAEFRPAVFIMENVKGILTSTVEGALIFESIKSDLRHPGRVCGIHDGEGYVLVSLAKGANGAEPEAAAEDFIIRSEQLGLPQARHRVIICGIREDVFARAGCDVHTLLATQATTVGAVIDDLPELQPALSWRGKGECWLSSFRLPMFAEALDDLKQSERPDMKFVAMRMESAVKRMGNAREGSGVDRALLSIYPQPEEHASWYIDRPVNLLANHESRSHMREDLVRYLFVSAFGQEMGVSPRLADFPRALLPNHRNVNPAEISAAIFKDRFRVQLRSKHSMTVTSHIGKDGHAFIHYDPVQCRSLTVREAARLQTFPDSYVFLGTRTSQYTQVGNAVPPLLARKIGDVVGDVLMRAGLTS